jgi:hypothetical protein
MGMGGIIAGAVAAAHAGTVGLQVEVSHEAWILADALGAASFAAPIPLTAFVQEGVLDVPKPDGQVMTTKARLGFVGPVAPNGAPKRREPFDPRDKITLPSGITGRIVEVPGTMLNPDTGAPYTRTVWLV